MWFEFAVHPKCHSLIKEEVPRKPLSGITQEDALRCVWQNPGLNHHLLSDLLDYPTNNATSMLFGMYKNRLLEREFINGTFAYFIPEKYLEPEYMPLSLSRQAKNALLKVRNEVLQGHSKSSRAANTGRYEPQLSAA